MSTKPWLSASGTAGRHNVDETLDLLDDHVRRLLTGPVAPTADQSTLLAWLRGIDFEAPREPLEAISATLEQFQRANVHTIHAGYFGLFNPAPILWGEIADLMAARLNPQLAVWSHAPAAVEIEEHTLRFVAARLNIPGAQGFFSSGGEEANRCGALVGLVGAFQTIQRKDFGPVKANPCSTSHLRAIWPG